MFNDELLSRLRLEPEKTCLEVAEIARRRIDFGTSSGYTEPEHEVLKETAALLVEVVDAGLLQAKVEVDPPSDEEFSNPARLFSYMTAVEEGCKAFLQRSQIAISRNRFRAALGQGFSYEFSQGDLDRVQALLNELRAAVSALKAIEDDHRARLLHRLESLQAELHKRVGSLDRFWAMVGEAGVVLGKFGTDAKPIVDRVRELVQIVWKTQARSEELPSDAGFPKLGGEGADQLGQ
jgi:hypothetical protein